MRSFLIIAHKFKGEINLRDLPGSGRIDVIARCINSAIFLSHNIRRDVKFFVYFPKIGVRIKIDSSKVKYLNPDERSTAALIRNAIINMGENEKMTSPGFYIKTSSLKGVLMEIRDLGDIYQLDENGLDIREFSLSSDPSFVLSDSLNLTLEEEKIIEKFSTSKISVGPRSILASHVISIVHNELDRRGL